MLIVSRKPKAIMPGQEGGKMTRSIRRLIRVTTTSILLAMSILTAGKGRIRFMDHEETWYNLNMSRVVQRADAYYGLKDVYKVRDDGVKTYNGFVICAGNYSEHPYGSTVETSRGIGIILDHTGKGTDKTLIDIATNW